MVVVLELVFESFEAECEDGDEVLECGCAQVGELGVDGLPVVVEGLESGWELGVSGGDVEALEFDGEFCAG